MNRFWSQFFHKKHYEEPVDINPDLIISLSIRFLQFIVVILNLAFASFIVNKIDGVYGRGIYIIILSVLTINYLIVLFLMCFIRIFTTCSLMIFEFLFGVGWLIGFALITDDFANWNCNRVRTCELGKAIIAFSLLLWIWFFSLTLFIPYQCLTYKLTKLKLDQKYQLGGIFVVPVKNEKISNLTSNSNPIVTNLIDSNPIHINTNDSNMAMHSYLNNDVGNVVVDLDPDTTHEIHNSVYPSTCDPTKPPPTPPTTFNN